MHAVTDVASHRRPLLTKTRLCCSNTGSPGSNTRSNVVEWEQIAKLTTRLVISVAAVAEWWRPYISPYLSLFLLYSCYFLFIHSFLFLSLFWFVPFSFFFCLSFPLPFPVSIFCFYSFLSVHLFFPSFPTDFHITCIRPSYNRGHVYLALLPWKCKRLGTWDHHPIGTTVCASLLAAFETFARVSRNLIRTNVKATPTLYCLRNFLQSITAMHKLESHDRH